MKTSTCELIRYGTGTQNSRRIEKEREGEKSSEKLRVTYLCLRVGLGEVNKERETRKM